MSLATVIPAVATSSVLITGAAEVGSFEEGGPHTVPEVWAGRGNVAFIPACAALAA